MSFSSRRRNYLLTPHRRDGLIEWMKAMLMHSFVLDALDTTGADTFSHFEELIDEERKMTAEGLEQPSRLKQLVSTIGIFHTRLPLRRAFLAYNSKHQLTKRRHVYISFNEIRHILNLAQIMALCKEEPKKLSQALHSPSPMALVAENVPPPLSLDGISLENEAADKTKPKNLPFDGPKMITFDGDQTLYSDGANFEENPTLANYLYLLLRNGVIVAVVTAAGYEYQTEKYMFRLSGLLAFFKEKGLSAEDCERFYLFGGECNYLLRLRSDYQLHPVKEYGPGGWMTATQYLAADSPANWKDEEVKLLLDVVEATMNTSINEQNLRAMVIRKKRGIGTIPKSGELISREALDETVLRCQDELSRLHNRGGINLPFCAFNGGRDVWVDVGNKRVGVKILQSYLGIPVEESLHIGDQFLNTGNDHAARDTCPCIWITSPEETTYILKKILQLAGVAADSGLGGISKEVSMKVVAEATSDSEESEETAERRSSVPGSDFHTPRSSLVNFQDVDRRTSLVMDVYTGELTKKKP